MLFTMVYGNKKTKKNVLLVGMTKEIHYLVQEEMIS